MSTCIFLREDSTLKSVYNPKKIMPLYKSYNILCSFICMCACELPHLGLLYPMIPACVFGQTSEIITAQFVASAKASRSEMESVSFLPVGRER